MSTSSHNSGNSIDPPPVKLTYIPLPEPLPSLPTSTSIVVTATTHPGYPCRRCLLDAQPGETVHLLSYDPFSFNSKSPYRSPGPIYVHARECELFQGEVLPETQAGRVMSVRAYDAGDMMVEAEVVQGGRELEKVVGQMLSDDEGKGTVKYVHVHNAKPGCFAFKVRRA